MIQFAAFLFVAIVLFFLFCFVAGIVAILFKALWDTATPDKNSGHKKAARSLEPKYIPGAEVNCYGEPLDKVTS